MNTLEFARILFGIPVAILLPLTMATFSHNCILSTIAALTYGTYASIPLFPRWQFWLAITIILTFHLGLRIITGVQHRSVSLNARRIEILPTSRLIAFIIIMTTSVAFGILITGGFEGVYSIGKLVIDDRVVLVVTGCLVAIFIGGAAISLIVQPLTKSIQEFNTSIPRLLQVGAHVGHAERLLLFILIIGGAPEAAVLALTAKSLVRLPSISNDMNQAEYYLVGTLSSMAVSLMVAIGTRLTLGLTPL